MISKTWRPLHSIGTIDAFRLGTRCNRRPKQCELQLLGQIRFIRTGVLPPLFKQNADGSEEPISEENIFQHTRYRWMTNDTEELARRYRKFSIPDLVDAALKAVGGPNTVCTKIVKLLEGDSNKALLLELDGRFEIVARIPTPNVGSPFYTIASEVATRAFLREVLEVRVVPRVASYSADTTNPVGAEFILEAKAKGEPLSKFWEKWDVRTRKELVEQWVDIEAKLTAVSFAQHGCIYDKQYQDAYGVPASQVQAILTKTHQSSYQIHQLLETLALGPLTASSLWRDGRANMNLDRGPFDSPLHYIGKLGLNEIQWAEAHAKPHISPYRSVDVPIPVEEYISFLDRYCQLMHHLPLPRQPKYLSHPNLTLDRIFINPDTNSITDIIGWQSAAVSEPIFQYQNQYHIAPFLLPTLYGPRLKEDHTGPTGDFSFDKHKAECEEVGTHYIQQRYEKNKQYQLLTEIPNRALMLKPSWEVTGAWSRSNAYEFRHALAYLIAEWGKIEPDSQGSDDCPIDFTEEEKNEWWGEYTNRRNMEGYVQMLHDRGWIPKGGRVPAEKYEFAVKANEKTRETLRNFAELETEQKRQVWEYTWPYRGPD